MVVKRWRSDDLPGHTPSQEKKMTKTEWDYSALAAFYDNRADYADAALDYAMGEMKLSAGDVVADIGAGTGKLSRPLAQRGLRVNAVEPNDQMRERGIVNTQGMTVTWRDGTGEQTGLQSQSVAATFFGSSFNVVDPDKALAECRRLVTPQGWFCCLWNHRDLDDPIQARIEDVIRSFIPDYTYGSRRQDPSDILNGSGLFSVVQAHDASFVATMSKSSVIEAWRSHGTLARQAGSTFDQVIAAIEQAIDAEAIPVPYTTRLWVAQFKS